MYNSLWYESLNRPFLNPPAWIFRPVWIILYVLIFAALIIYILKPSSKSKMPGYIFFTVQMVLNLAWSPAFFHMQNISLALVIIVFLDIFALLAAKSFHTVSKTTAILFVPYLIWIFFASYLNFAYLILNS